MNSFVLNLFNYHIPWLLRADNFAIYLPARVSIGILNEAFPNCIISRKGAIPWPPRSTDLKARDFFRLGYLKNKVIK